MKRGANTRERAPLIDELRKEHEQGQEADDAEEKQQTHPGRSPAACTQVGGAGMLGAVEALAITADAAGQSLAFVASGWLVIFRFLRPPPERLARGRQRRGADAVGAAVPRGDARPAAH